MSLLEFKLIIIAILILPGIIFSQEIIKLDYEELEGVEYSGGEHDYYSEIWDNRVVTNVSVPTMQVFRPEPDKSNGASVVIAPGGGLYALSMNSEGDWVAQWLVEKGYTAFVLKYRLVPTGEDGVKEISDIGASNPKLLMEKVNKVIPSSIADGLNAIRYVREHSREFMISGNKIGFMGFSAGGAVTMGVMYDAVEENKPNFIVPVYPWTTAYPVRDVPELAVPMLVVCAHDDPLGLAKGSLELYGSWLSNGRRAALHMYSKGGHGFGMRKQGLASDSWIDRFHEWALDEGIVGTRNF